MRGKIAILPFLILLLFSYVALAEENCKATEVSNFEIRDGIYHALKYQDYIFIAYRTGVKVLDKSGNEINRISFMTPRIIKIVDNYLIIGGSEGINVYKMESPTNVQFISKVVDIGVFDFHIKGNMLLAGCGCKGLRVYDISDIKNPEIIGGYGDVGVQKIVYRDGKVFALGSGVLRIFDITPSGKPELLSSYRKTLSIRDFALDGNDMYISTFNKVELLKISDTYSFNEGDGFEIPVDRVDIRGLELLGNLLFVSTNKGTYIYDIHNFPLVELKASLPPSQDVSFYKNLLYVIGDTNLYIYDMSKFFSCFLDSYPVVTVLSENLNIEIKDPYLKFSFIGKELSLNDSVIAHIQNVEKIDLYINNDLTLSLSDNDLNEILFSTSLEKTNITIIAENQFGKVEKNVSVFFEAVDSDNDNVPDFKESLFGLNPYSLDSDNDGIPDSQEFQNGRDTDNDGIIDALDTDSDNDGISDKDEVAYGLDPFTNDAGLDSDNDGFTNIEEIEKGTNPNDKTSFPVYSISVDPSTIDFGEALISEELTKTINIKNTGNQPISIENVYSESGIISIENNCPISLDPNEMCQITVFLSSSQEGNIEDILVIETTAKTINLPITASIIDPEIPVVLEWQNEYFTKLSVQSNDTYRIYIKDLDNNVFLDREVNNTSLLIPSFFLSPEKMYQVLIRSGKKENSLEISGLAINGDNNNNGLEDYKEIKITDKFAMLKTESGKNMPLGLSTDGEFLKIVDILDIQEIYKQNLNIDYGILGIVVKNGSFIKVEFPESTEISTIDPITKEIKEIKGNVINLKEEDIDGLDNSVSVVVVAIKGQLQNREMQDIDNDLISGSLDEDNDGISDFTEGYSDTDNDGLPDFKDPDADGDNVPDFIEDKETYKQGNRIKVVINNDVLSKIQDDIPESVKGKEIEISVSDNDAVIKPIDGKTLPVFDPVEKPKEFKFPYGVFSFQIENISPGETVNIVIKLPAPIPEDASLIKYTNTTNYVTIDNVHSSLDGSNWEEGLVPGNIYIKYPVQDGGIYDEDGQTNGKIIDPVGVAVLDEVSDNQDNVPSDNQDQNTDNQVSDSQTTGTSSGGGGCSLSKESDISLVFVVILLALIGARRLKDIYKVQTN